MTAEGFPRHTVRKIENMNFPLIALGAMRELCAYLDEAEAQALRKARELGASAEDIAEALGITRQGAYYKLKALETEGGGASEPAESDAEPEPTLVIAELDEDRTA